MSDPISRLDQFRADSPGAPMSSAAEARRRGDQIRRRTRAVVTAGTAAVAAIVAGPIIFLSTGIGDQGVDPARSDSISAAESSAADSVSPSDLTRANLPTEDDLVADDPYPAWVQEQTYDGEGTDPYNDCLTESLGDSGATTTFRRDFVAKPGAEMADAAGTLNAVVGEFDSADEAEKVSIDLSDAAISCSGVDGAELAGTLPVEGDVISSGSIDVVTYSSDEPDMNAVWEVATAVVSAEDRVLVMTRKRGVQDYVSPTTLQTSAANAANRLVGVTPPAEPSTDPAADPTATGSPTEERLGDANLVAAGELPALDRFESALGWNRYTPTPDVPTLACQKEWLSTLGATAKVAADYRWDTDRAMVGQVHVAVLEFSDVNAAGAAYNEVMEWMEVCPANKLGVDPEVTALPRDVSADLDAGPKRAARSQATYPGSDGNDSIWFETELVAEYETRLVLVGYAESAGPCPPSTGDKEDPCYQPDQPDSWPGRILAIEKAAVTAGISDLR
ncbi:LigA [Nocardioidaceae bacterium Broad-1]|nr:LigA [Nocardioidaceae bacterium Broad-1]